MLERTDERPGFIALKPLARQITEHLVQISRAYMDVGCNGCANQARALLVRWDTGWRGLVSLHL